MKTAAQCRHLRLHKYRAAVHNTTDLGQCFFACRPMLPILTMQLHAPHMPCDSWQLWGLLWCRHPGACWPCPALGVPLTYETLQQPEHWLVSIQPCCHKFVPHICSMAQPGGHRMTDGQAMLGVAQAWFNHDAVSQRRLQHAGSHHHCCSAKCVLGLPSVYQDLFWAAPEPFRSW